MAQKKNNCKRTNRKPSKKKLDPIVKVAIINGIFAILVALVNKLV